MSIRPIHRVVIISGLVLAAVGNALTYLASNGSGQSMPENTIAGSLSTLGFLLFALASSSVSSRSMASGSRPLRRFLTLIAAGVFAFGITYLCGGVATLRAAIHFDASSWSRSVYVGIVGELVLAAGLMIAGIGIGILALNMGGSDGGAVGRTTTEPAAVSSTD